MKEAQGAGEVKSLYSPRQGQQRGHIRQLGFETMERAHGLFCFLDEAEVAFLAIEVHGRVDVAYGNVMAHKGLGQHGFLEAVMGEPLVEGIASHDLAAGHEVAGPEGVIGVREPAGKLAGTFRCPFIAIAKARRIALFRYVVSAIDHFALGGEEAEEIVFSRNGHVAVDEEQPGVVGSRG